MSKAIKSLQERCGVTADGAFGPNTAKAISKHYELSPERAAHLLGQSAHESGYFKLTEENLNYSEKALKSVFGRYFGTYLFGSSAGTCKCDIELAGVINRLSSSSSHA